ncbi:hypothetical protein V1512DRAFT_131063 [Lipomyces arxii]|uniref:uncharacterized protein n=1 Tax=Lipomyces arxii TaxID=56418 RepID=UPI0034CE5F0F
MVFSKHFAAFAHFSATPYFFNKKVFLSSMARPIARNARIVIVGGNIGGHAAAYALTKTLVESPLPMPYITLVEPRQGVLNAIAVPRAMVEPGFAQTTFEPTSSFSKAVLDHVDLLHSYVTRITD